jgi:Curli production assembly/transport component CsgG/PEGA domain
MRIEARRTLPIVAGMVMLTSVTAMAQPRPAVPLTTIIMVAPFENGSPARTQVVARPGEPGGTLMLDRHAEAARSTLEDILIGLSRVRVVERQRVDSLLLEAEFGQFSGLVDPGTAVRMGKLVGANAVAIGSILDARTTTKDFAGYGIQTRNTEVSTAVRVRIVDMATGQIAFSRVLHDSITYAASSYGRTSDSDPVGAVIAKALQQLRNDEAFLRSIPSAGLVSTPVTKVSPGTSQSLVEVAFAVRPENSDVEINGRYVGGSPLRRQLEKGVDVRVRIAKAGYKSWEGVIVPEQGMRITRELEREVGQ